MARVAQEVLDLQREVGQLFQEGMAQSFTTTQLLLSTATLCSGRGEIGMGTQRNKHDVNRTQNTLFTHYNSYENEYHCSL